MYNYNDFISYISNALTCYGYEINSAVEYMERYRCPLSTASEKIVDIMEDAIRDFCDDNEIDYYNFNYEEVFDTTLDDIFFDAIENIDNPFQDNDEEDEYY